MIEPLISCLMVSRGALYPAAHAIACYQRQSYPRRELVILSTAEDDPVARFVCDTGDPTIRHIATPPATLGEMRNAAIAHARGDLIATWDDDDLHHRDRLARQLAAMESNDVKACFLQRVLLWWPARRQLRVSHAYQWEGTMLAHRAIVPIFPAVPREEDLAAVAAMLKLHRAALLDWPKGYCYAVHGGNTNSTAHFDPIFAISLTIAGGEAYDDALALMAADHDFAGYAAAAN